MHERTSSIIACILKTAKSREFCLELWGMPRWITYGWTVLPRTGWDPNSFKVVWKYKTLISCYFLHSMYLKIYMSRYAENVFSSITPWGVTSEGIDFQTWQLQNLWKWWLPRPHWKKSPSPNDMLGGGSKIWFWCRSQPLRRNPRLNILTFVSSVGIKLKNS